MNSNTSQWNLEDLFMKLTPKGTFVHYDNQDLDFLITTWLGNKARGFTEADRMYYSLAEKIAMWNKLLHSERESRT